MSPPSSSHGTMTSEFADFAMFIGQSCLQEQKQDFWDDSEKQLETIYFNFFPFYEQFKLAEKHN